MIIKAMEQQLEAIGVKPIIPADALMAPWILTMDQVLPPSVNMSPPQVAAIGTAAITAQRFYHRKAIAAAIAAQTVAERTAPQPPPPPAPIQPAPVPPPEPAPEPTAEPEPAPAPEPEVPPELLAPWDFKNERGEVVI